ncbi:MAG: hypothetical protein Q9187_000939 [Circinaria calcarea]
MGRYDFRPHRVHQAVTQLLATEKLASAPSWYNVIAAVPPTQTLVRTQPLKHHSNTRGSRTRKPSKLFQPEKISYKEDRLRREFFGDHPWELARPRVVLENDGTDARRRDWSHIRQEGRPLNGESVVQRQMWLMENVPDMSKAMAYDQARQEFYDERLQEDVERRVAKEEAVATGAYFGKSMLQIGMELEDKEYERWKAWATKEMMTEEQKRASGYTSVDNSSESISGDDPDLDAGLDESEAPIPAED